MGKSRLLAEIRQRIGEKWTTLTGHCYKQDVSFPFCPWVDALYRYLILDPDSKINETPGILIAQLARLLPTLEEQVPHAAARHSADVEEDKRHLFNAVLQLILNAATTQPVLIAIEDAHWSDEASLDLLRFIVRRISNYPVLLIITYRSDEILPALSAFLAEMDRERAAGEIRLAPFNRQEVEEMAGLLLGNTPAAKLDFLDALLPLMEGNPFYIEEILHSLVESGILSNEGGAWTRKETDRLQIPRSIQETVLRFARDAHPGGGRRPAVRAAPFRSADRRGRCDAPPAGPRIDRSAVDRQNIPRLLRFPPRINPRI